MSLRLRLIVSIALVLIVSLAFGGALACWHAGRSVRTEMRAALAVGEQTVRSELASLGAAGSARRQLDRLVGSFDGDRHIQAKLLDDSGVAVAVSAIATNSPAEPEWFHRLFGGALPALVIPLPANAEQRGAIELQTDSHNEVGEVWSEFRDALLIVALFCGPTFLLIYWTLGRALRPLASLSEAFGRIGSGDRDSRLVEAGGPPELAGLTVAFNAMAARLAAMEAQNRSLNEQLMTLLDEERRDLARDLHDEVGPFLFAVNIDVATIQRLLVEGDRLGEIPGRLRAIGEAVGHMQKHVKAILGRLRPIGLAEFGLGAAIDNLVKFWRSRHPEIAFVVDVAGEGESFGDPLDVTIYRIIQESLSNAVRHGHPRRIEIAVANDPLQGVIARVTDDGTGIAEPGSVGFGLLGMRERVAAVGGSLLVEGGAGSRGLSVTARLPPADAA